ncbi:MAG: T9SS type A sorting domain-containing protein [Flavipsychrobacter sp.]|nr:T9SS type A sorting domain-containing protein [Flavipsychrobacter sp.]
MNYPITNARVRFFLLFLTLFTCTGAWAQNPVVSLTGGPCVGSILTVTSNSTPTQIAFSLNGNIVATSTSATYTTTAAGSYTATVTTATGSASTSAVVISALTTPSIVISAIPSGTNICAGTNVNLNASVTTQGTAPTYLWKKNGSPVGTNSPTYSVNTLATGDVINCTLISNAACASPTSASSNNITYTINPPLTPSVSIVSYSGTSICSGTPLLFVATPTNGGPTPSYQWYVNGTLTLTTSVDSFITTALNNNDSVYCKMVTSVPCPTVETVISNKIGVSVSTSVTPSVTINANPGNTICAGTSVSFTATGINGGTSAQYQWLQNGTPITGANNSTYTSSSLVNNDLINATLLSNATCATNTLANSNVIKMTVNSAGTPAVSIIARNGSTLCDGDTATFIATPSFGGTSPTYTWLKNGTPLTTAINADSISVAGLSWQDSISVVLVSNERCATTTTATSNKIGFIVDQHMTMTVAISANPGASITAGDVVTFTASITDGGTVFSYQWYLNGVKLTGSISPTYSTNTLANNDVVTCIVTAAQPCITNPIVTSNAITMHVSSNVTGLHKGALTISIYPNPNSGNFTVNGNVGDEKEVRIEVSNLLGQVVYATNHTVSNGILNQQLNLPSTIPNGLYQVKIKTNSAFEVIKFVLNK